MHYVASRGEFSKTAREVQLSLKCPKKINGQIRTVMFKFHCLKMHYNVFQLWDKFVQNQKLFSVSHFLLVFLSRLFPLKLCHWVNVAFSPAPGGGRRMWTWWLGFPHYDWIVWIPFWLTFHWKHTQFRVQSCSGFSRRRTAAHFVLLCFTNTL